MMEMHTMNWKEELWCWFVVVVITVTSVWVLYSTFIAPILWWIVPFGFWMTYAAWKCMGDYYGQRKVRRQDNDT